MKQMNRLNNLISTVSSHLANKQPSTKEIGQVWQIIPNDKSKEPELGVIIKKNPLFTTFIMLRRGYSIASTEGNDKCLFKAKETELGTDFIAAYWCPFITLFKSNLGRYICSLSQEHVEKIKESYNSNILPTTIEGDWFRAECIAKSKGLGFEPPIALNFDFSKIGDKITATLAATLANTLIHQTSTFAALTFAAPSDEKLFNDFQYHLIEELTKDDESEFFKKIYIDYNTISNTEFHVELSKNVNIIFFDKEGNAIDSIIAENQKIIFNLSSMNKKLFSFQYLVITNV